MTELHEPANPHDRQRRRQPGLPLGAWTLGLLLFATVAGLVRMAGGLHPAAAQELGIAATAPDDGAPAVDTSSAPAAETPAVDVTIDSFAVHVPAGARDPLTVIVALHGMGGNGQDEADSLRSLTDAQGWTIVAPTFGYGDWRDPNQLRVEDPADITRIASFLDRLPQAIGHSVRRQVLLYGFSRGGQTANRFALAYPDRVTAAALGSSGTYTLPVSSIDGNQLPLRFPYGVADFSSLFGQPFDSATFTTIPFWIGVGSRDVDGAELPHQWDAYIGDDRVERAQRFADWLRQAGMQVQVQVFPGMGHGDTPELRAGAVRFLASVNG